MRPGLLLVSGVDILWWFCKYVWRVINRTNIRSLLVSRLPKCKFIWMCFLKGTKFGIGRRVRADILKFDIELTVDILGLHMDKNIGCGSIVQWYYKNIPLGKHQNERFCRVFGIKSKHFSITLFQRKKNMNTNKTFKGLKI